MNCPNCGSELYIDHQDTAGKIFYTCLNKRCAQYKKSFNPITDEKKPSTFKEQH